MSWTMYDLDRRAHDLVLKFRDQGVLAESHKMRVAVNYGLERFWGEHLRLQNSDQAKADYWKGTWDELVKIMKQAGITIPNDPVNPNNHESIKQMAAKLWDSIPNEQRKVALAVLMQLCDSMVWWTQRYKPGNNGNDNGGRDE